MLAIDDLVRDYGDSQVEQSNKDRLWALLAEKIAPAGFVAIDILRIEAGFFFLRKNVESPLPLPNSACRRYLKQAPQALKFG